jgi:hypothetical protein
MLTDEEIREEVMVPPRRTFLAATDLQLVDRPGWLQISTPSMRDGGMNEVVHVELTDDEADATIARVCADYRALGVKWRWRVGPGSTPADLGDRLARHGMVRREVSGMARATRRMRALRPPHRSSRAWDFARSCGSRRMRRLARACPRPARRTRPSCSCRR